MGGDLVRVELSSPKEVKSNHMVWKIIYEGGMDNIINALKGHDEGISLEVARSWEDGRCRVNGMEVIFRP